MTRATEHRVDMAATVVSLATEATELKTRADELRRELLDLDERIEAVTDALHQLPAHSAATGTTAAATEPGTSL